MRIMLNKRESMNARWIVSLLPILSIAFSSIVCRGSDVRSWTTTSFGPTRIRPNLNVDRVIVAQARTQQHPLLERIRRGGGGANETDDLESSAHNNNNTDSEVEPFLSPPTSSSSPDGFEILGEEIVYSGWRTILKRRIRMRNGKTADFDLVGVKTGGGAVLIFAWDTQTKTATIIREYMPASNRILWGLAAGLIEDKHGQNTELAARHELEEECHLKGGEWIPLLTQPADMDKYATTTIQCYLVIDPEPEPNPKPLDDEEDIEIISGVTIPEILRYVRNGEMNLVGGYGSLLAIEKLRELGEHS